MTRFRAVLVERQRHSKGERIGGQIDRSHGNGSEELAGWRICALGMPAACDDPVAHAWAATRHRFRIPRRYAEQLMDGVARDLTSQRYATFDELAAYCYGVASTVGLMAMHIIWRMFMRFQIGRTRQLYSEAVPGIKLLDADGRFAIGAAAELYAAILGDIERHDYDVFTRRAHITTWDKFRRLPGIWWRATAGDE